MAPVGERDGVQIDRRQLFALSAALAATVLTAGAAIAGLARKVSPVPVAPTPVVQTVLPTPARVEPGD